MLEIDKKRNSYVELFVKSSSQNTQGNRVQSIDFYGMLQKADPILNDL